MTQEWWLRADVTSQTVQRSPAALGHLRRIEHAPGIAPDIASGIGPGVTPERPIGNTHTSNSSRRSPSTLLI